MVAQTANCGAPDTVLAQIAIIEARVIVSEDYDFGELAVRDALPIPGVILLSVLAPRKSERAARLIAVIDELGDALTGHLTIILPERIRRRRLR